MLGPTAHTDTFARDNLPPPEQWPDFRLDGLDYPDQMNAAVEITDRMVERGFGDRTALVGHGRRRTYKELADWSNRLARALIEDYGVKPGNRVLIRSANNPAMIACWLAATKAGAVVVNTMPMLRAGELTKIVDKAEIGLALCDTRILDELVACAKDSRFLKSVVGFDGTANHDAELDRLALNKPVTLAAVPTGRDDAESGQDHRSLQSDRLLHGADRLSRDARGDGRGSRSLLPSIGRVRGRDASRAGLRGLDKAHRRAAPRRHRLDGNAACVHRLPSR